MNPNSTGAIMGQSRYRINEPAEISAAQQDSNAKVQAAKQEENANASLASLANNGGWMILEAKMQRRIDAYKSGSTLVDFVASKVDSEKLGELLYREMKVAAELESFIKEVTTAQAVLEQEKEERRNAIRRTRA